MFWCKRRKKEIFILSLLVILVLPVIQPLFHSGFFQNDDGEWMVIRFSAFHQALRDGQFPVRWLGRLSHEYGYPMANFLYPGFMYLAEIPKVIGFNYVDSVKIIMGLSLVTSAVFIFLWLKNLFTPLAAFIGALFYLYAPYHLWDLYKRGSVGEILALAVVPFILWIIEKKNFFFYSMGIGLLILSHNTLAILFVPIIIIYALLRKILKTRYLMLNTILGFGVAAFFWLPAIYDLQYTRFFQTQIFDSSQHFANFNLTGLNIILVCLISPFLRLCLHDSNHVSKKLLRFFFIICFLSIFLTLPLSTFIWKFLPINFIQFPFRLLSVTILCGAFLTANLIDYFSDKKKIAVVVTIVLLIFISSWPYLQPKAFFDKGEGFYATNEGTTTVQNEYLPLWVEKIPIAKAVEKVAIISGRGKINNLQTNSKKTSFEISAQTESEVRINIFYFPGWKVKVDGQSTIIQYHNPGGVMSVIIPSGNHLVVAEFQETPIRLAADLISLISLTGLMILFFKRR